MSISMSYKSSPLLASRTPVWRSKFVVAVTAVAFITLIVRAFYIQVGNNNFFQKQGAVRFARTLEIPANRGRILDRNGFILASSVPSSSIYAVAEDIELNDIQKNRLTRLLNIKKDGLNKSKGKGFIWLKRQVDESVAREVASMGLKGIYSQKEYRREYPGGQAVAHVVGFNNVEDKGQEGVELAFDEVLQGVNGFRRVIKDRMGRVVEVLGETIEPRDGKDLQLSIDSNIQFFAFQKLKEAVEINKAKAGSVVVIDAQTGEVLALTNYPSFYPMKREKLTGEQLRNRAVTDTFEPGSVIKPFTIALALETGRLKPESKIDTGNGRFTITGASISDTHANGILSVQEVIEKSSNIGTAKIALQLKPDEMWDFFTQSGFGQKPQIKFPGVVSGRLRPAKTWRPIEQATMSYGYGLSASLFQMVRSYTVFSNNGEIIPLTLLKSSTPAHGIQVLSSKTAKQIRTMLQMAAGPQGTGARAQTIGYSVGGKSGTAYKQIGKGYGTPGNRKYRGWFVGMAPIENPRIVVGVMIDEPSGGQYYGGVVAAPVFSEVVQQTLRAMNIQPDLNFKPEIIADLVQESS